MYESFAHNGGSESRAIEFERSATQGGGGCGLGCARGVDIDSPSAVEII